MQNFKLKTVSLLNKQKGYMADLEGSLCASKRKTIKVALQNVNDELSKRDGMNFHTAHKERKQQEINK